MRLLAAILLLIAVPRASAIITYGTGDPSHNTNAPTGAFANSGWELAGMWGVAFLGWPIGPHHFLTASHVGGSVPQPLVWHGVSYASIAADALYWTNFGVPTLSDVKLWTISGTFPTWARVFTNSSPDETGRPTMMIGRGTQRGSAYTPNCTGVPTFAGWDHGTDDQVVRWGTNITTIVGGGFTAMVFDATEGNDVGVFSAGDSSGAVFVLDGGIWKLDGINLTTDPIDHAVFLGGCTPSIGPSTSSASTVRTVWDNILAITGPIPDPPATTLGIHVQAVHLGAFHFGP